jgi:hypothetical protein
MIRMNFMSFTTNVRRDYPILVEKRQDENQRRRTRGLTTMRAQVRLLAIGPNRKPFFFAAESAFF